MKQRLTLCKRNRDNSLTIIGDKVCDTLLNESEMIVYATCNKKRYPVEGSIYMWYIVVESEK